MKIKLLLAICLILSGHANLYAETQSLYQITLLRAHPGQLEPLIKEVEKHKVMLKNKMIIMRHSQGDHWDLMLLSPAVKDVFERKNYSQRVDFQDEFIASSDLNWQQITQLSQPANLFHIEMFYAARGQYQSLYKQRQMENNYLLASRRNANAIFETQFGSDVDLFTIGFYPDLKSFATDPELDEAVFEKAAIDAGFKSRADIGFYLRQFLVSHQDTLATQIH